MADYQAVPTGSSTQDLSRQPPVTATLVVYALFAVAAIAAIIGHGMLVGAPLLTIIGVVGVIVAYITRGDARGTWTESHLTWLIRTFWWSFLLNCLGWLLAVTLIGLPVALAIWIGTTIWVIYRVIRGYLLFHASKPVPGM
jgi:uncharacterized membrane protein